MTESKYVKISEELRDRIIAQYGEYDQCAHSQSQELGAGNHIENCQMCVDIEALRAAPSVETPEQSGGVVTRKMIGDAIFNAEHDNDDGSQSLRSIVNAVHALQIPTPPMQASEVRGMDLLEAVKELDRQATDAADILDRAGLALQPRSTKIFRQGIADRFWEVSKKLDKARHDIAHLQQAPQGVGSRTFVVKNGALYETTMGIWCRIFEAKNLNGEDSIFTLQSPVKMTIQPQKDKP